MRQYISEGRAIYEDENHGLFSKRLAEFAIGHMETKDEGSQMKKALKPHSIDEMKEVLEANNVKLPSEFIYTAWYLFNMAFADYPKTLTTDKLRATYIEETLCDPDGCPENVLDCFVTKMCNAGVPIYWEMML
jgi:hypothetical protein